MKFKVHSKALYSAISAVSKVINAKNALAILNNFLFDVDREFVTITASDLENTLSAKVEISDLEGEPRKFCVDARRSVELFKILPELMVEFEIDDNLAISIEYPGDKFNLIGLNGDEYPSSQSESETEPITFTCPAEQLILGIDNTLFAVGNDDLRPNMMGIFLDIKPDAITFVSTDTRKLVKYRNSMSAPQVTASCILPVKPATILRNVFSKEGDLKITIDSKSASIEGEAFSFNCRLIKHTFPDYNRVIPTNNPYTLTVDRRSMLNAVRRVGVFVDPSHGLVKFRIQPDAIELKAQDTNFCASGLAKIPCSFTGDELTIGFSAPFIIEIFNTIATENVVVKLADPSRPGVFTPEEDNNDSELLMLLMPMTVGNF